MRPRLGVDIDGVCSETIPGLIDAVYRFFGYLLTEEQITSSKIEQNHDIPEPIRNHISWLFNEPSFYHSLSIVPGAADALRILFQDADIFYVTARPLQLQLSTMIWLADKGFPPGNLLHSSDKAEIARGLRIGVWIEDTAEQAKALAGTWATEVVLLDYPWNRPLESLHVHRVLGWDEAAGAVRYLLEKAVTDKVVQPCLR